MVDEQQPTPPDSSPLPNRLHEIAQLLRQTHHLGPDAQQALADLADQLGGVFEQAQSPAAATQPVVESIANVVQALHPGAARRGPFTAARERLQELAASVEGRAPNLSAFVGRLLDTLADLGI